MKKYIIIVNNFEIRICNKKQKVSFKKFKVTLLWPWQHHSKSNQWYHLMFLSMSHNFYFNIFLILYILSEIITCNTLNLPHPVCKMFYFKRLIWIFGNEIRYKFCSCGNLFGFEGNIVLSKRVFCRWRHVELLKVTIIFLNKTIIFQTSTIVARKMTSSTICDKRSFKVI